MRELQLDKREVDICKEKIKYLLKEFNCKIEYDSELQDVILVDKDNLEFEYINKINLKRY